jgi:hypothetical protein
MFKKTLISLAVASSLGLTGCFDSAGTGANANPEYSISNPAFDGKTWPLFNPVTKDLPIPSDLNLDQKAKDGSYGVDGDLTNPVIGALNKLSGASTVAPAVIQFSGDIDPDSVDSRAFIFTDPQDPTSVVPNPNQNVFLIELKYASEAPVRTLSIGEPPTIPLAITVQVAGGANPLGTGTDLSGRNQAAAGAYLAGLAATPAYDHDVVKLDGTSAIRIRPNKPLNPRKRYIVAITDGVKDINGEPITGDPVYQNVTIPDAPVGDSKLKAVQSLATGLWEPVTANYFGVNNSSRTAMGLPALTKDDIAVSYSFTTSDDKKVLSYIGNPATWFADQVRRSVTVGAAAAAVGGGAADFATVSATVRGALGAFKPSDLNAGLAPCDGAGPYNAGPLGTFTDQFLCAGTLLEAKLNSTLASTPYSLPEPHPRSYDIGSATDVLDISSVLSALPINRGNVDVHQGYIELPQYIAVPDNTQTGQTSTIRTQSWQPDAAVAGIIGDVLGSTIPQENPEVSTVLNYNFPFPKEQGDVEVPMLVITPTGMDPTTDSGPGNNLIPVIFQHGITTDRSAALAFSSQLVASAADNGLNLAVFAIDQPLHGVAPFTAEEQQALAIKLLVAGGILPEAAVDPEVTDGAQDTIDAVIAGTFKFGAVLKIQAMLDEANSSGAPNLGISDPTNPTQLQNAIQTVLSGAIDGSAPTAKPSLQSAITLEHTVANAGSTIPGLAPVSTATGAVAGINERHYGYTAGKDGNPIKMDFSEGVGDSGSLFINLTNFPNTRDILRQGSVDLMNLTATINSMSGINTSFGVAFIGHSLGTLNGGAFVGAGTASGNPDIMVSVAHLLTPVAGTTRLLENSPSFAPTILNGLAAAGITQGDADYETFLNVNQAALDSVDPINFANELAVSGTVLGQIKGDRTTPNAADSRYFYGDYNAPLNVTLPDGLNIHSFAAPLTGSEALAAVMGATGLIPGDVLTGANLPAITRYTAGVHGTPALPQEVIAKKGEVLKDRTIAQGGETIVSSGAAQGTFGAMIQKTIELLVSRMP